MTVRCGVKAALWLLLLSPLCRAEVLTQIGDEPVAQIWRHWSAEAGLKNAVPPPLITVESRNPHQLKGLAGRARGPRIEVSELLRGAARESVLRHELAHVFLLMQPGTRIKGATGEAFYHEAVALSLSGDAMRIVAQAPQFPLRTEAKQFLKSQFRSPHLETSRLEAALSRLLDTEVARQVIVEALPSLLQTEDPPRAVMDLLLRGKTDIHRGPISFVVKDILSHEIVYSEGNIDRAFPVGSILKPVIFAAFPNMIGTSAVARADDTWACPTVNASLQRGRWTWREALSHSCNGFFLDQEKKIADWTSFSQLLTPFVKDRERVQARNMAAAIGLIPGVSLSSHEIADLYGWFAGHFAEVLKPLTETAADGTLSGQDDSAFFTARGIALKSGSVRGLGSQPEHGWIVAWIPGANKQYRFIAVISAPGYSGMGLLGQLKKRLSAAKYLSLGVTQVQVLGLLNEAQVHPHCGPGDRIDEVAAEPPARNHWTATEITSGRPLSCMKGATWVRVPLNSGRAVERPYWGKLHFAGRPPLEEGDSTAKEKRAHSGSAFWLETSERRYVAQVLASEAADSRREVLKALSLIVRQNAQSDRHGRDRPICDTTHCQVFNVADWATTTNDLRRYFEAYDETADTPTTGTDFLEFSRGGPEPWTRSLPEDKVKRFFNLQEASTMIRRENQWVGRTRAIDCETLRGRLHLLSCPERIRVHEHTIEFSGHGEGHGRGLDLSAADLMASRGDTFREILAHFFPERWPLR